jgi:hypothetical protein
MNAYDKQFEADQMSLINKALTAHVCRSLRSVAWMSALLLTAFLTHPVLADCRFRHPEQTHVAHRKDTCVFGRS